MNISEQEAKDMLVKAYRRIWFKIGEEEKMGFVQWSMVHCYWGRIVRNIGGLWFEGGLRVAKSRRTLMKKLEREVWGGIKNPDGTFIFDTVIKGEEVWYYHWDQTKDRMSFFK